MASLLTYNNIVDLLKDISARHFMLNGSFFVGKDTQMSDNADIVYPFFKVNLTNSRVVNSNGEYKTIEISLNCKVVDLTEQSQENEQDAQSDTLQICQDIITEISQHPYYQRSNAKLVGDIELVALEEWQDDFVAGHEFTLTMQLVMNQAFCGLPFNEINGYQFNGPVITGYTFNSQFLTCANVTGCTTLQQYILSLITSNSGDTLNQVLTQGNTTSGKNIIVNQSDAIQIGNGSAGITNSSNVLNPDHIILYSNSALTNSYLNIMDGNNLFEDDSVNGQVAITTGFNSIILNKQYDYIQMYSGALGISMFGNVYLYNGLTGTTAQLDNLNLQLLGNDNSLTDFLVKDSLGNVKVKTLSSILSSTTNTYITGLTFSNNILGLTNNSGNTLNVLINNFSGITANSISATSINGISLNFNTAITTTLSASTLTVNGAVQMNNNLTVNNILNAAFIRCFQGTGIANWIEGNLTVGATTAPRATLDIIGTAFTKILSATTISGLTLFISADTRLNGSTIVGTGSTNATALGILRIGQGTSIIDIGETASQGAIWLNQSSPSINNWSIKGSVNALALNANNASSNITLSVGNTVYFTVASAVIIATPPLSATTISAQTLFTQTAYTGILSATTITANTSLNFASGATVVSIREAIGLSRYGSLYGSGAITPNSGNPNLLFSPSGQTIVNSALGQTVVIANNTNTILAISNATVTFTDAINISFGTTTGTKIGLATTQKLAFWNATPIVQPINSVAIDDVLVTTGLRASGGTSNFTLPISATSITANSLTVSGFTDINYSASSTTAQLRIHNSSLNTTQTGLGLSNANSNSSSRNWAIITNDNVFGDFTLKTSSTQGGDAFSGTRRLYIDNNGSVGLGTITPTAKLEVNGNIIFSGLSASTNVTLNSIGSKLIIASGTNASIGIVTLTSGTATVNNTLVTTSSLIIPTIQGVGVLANLGQPYISSRVAGVSFTISSTNILDTDTIGWQIIEPK